MDLEAAGLNEQPFPSHGAPAAILSYTAAQAAIEVLTDTYTHITGLCLFQGPALSGKSTIIRRYINTLHEDCAVAFVDGTGLNTARLLREVLSQFGFKLESDSTSEMLGLIRVFALQQAAQHDPPLLVIDNAHALNPSALRALCELAGLRVRTGSALKIVLVSDRSLAGIMRSPSMEAVSRRLLHDFHLRPMREDETRHYLHAKLQAAGSEAPQLVFPDAVCTELWKASGGWPGILERLALMALAKAEALPIGAADIEHPALPAGTWEGAERVSVNDEPEVPRESPELIISNNGRVTGELRFTQQRLLIGRSDHNDLAIGSRFVSRHHALLVRHGHSTFLMDLNSTNGTFVNSRRVSNQILAHDDVITIGHHKIKFRDPSAQTLSPLQGSEFTETVIMKTLSDMRNLLAEENTAVLPAVSEELPSINS